MDECCGQIRHRAIDGTRHIIWTYNSWSEIFLDSRIDSYFFPILKVIGSAKSTWWGWYIVYLWVIPATRYPRFSWVSNFIRSHNQLYIWLTDSSQYSLCEWWFADRLFSLNQYFVHSRWGLFFITIRQMLDQGLVHFSDQLYRYASPLIWFAVF